MASKKILIQVDITTKSAEVNVDKVVNKLNQLEGATTKVTKATEKGRAQSGLNNAILLETGRLASDAAYGYTAIANNLSQVITLFSSFIETNKSVVASFKQLGASLLGTGGFLIAIQLVISFGPKIMEMLSGVTEKTKELKKVQEEANKVAGEQIGKLQTLVSVLDDVRSSTFEKQQAIDELNRSHKKLNLELDDEGRLTKESTKAIEEYIPMLQEKAKAQAIMSLIQTKYVKLIELETSSLFDNISLFDRAISVFKGILGFDDAFTDMFEKASERRAKAIEEITGEIAELMDMFNNLDTTGFEMNEQKIVRAFGRIGRSITLADQIKDMTGKSKDSLDEFGDNFTKFMKQMTKVEALETKTRIKIQQTYANSLRELSNSFKNLGFLTDDMKIAAIIAEKASEIAKVVITTKASNAVITATSNAAAALNPLSGVAIKANAKRLKLSNNMSSAVNIAAIVASAATGIRAIRSKGNVPTGIGGGDAGGEGGVVEAPDFNVVGAGGVSQLATGLAGITGKPIQAFVVSKEISSAQELDRNITGNASLG
tara:strand:- start:2232 stop:3866 length:1635 start_codon:yes stop_codon:yes gene_type:complete